MNNNSSSQSYPDSYSPLDTRQSPHNRTIVFIDSQVDDYLSLISGIDPQAYFAVLDADKDGIEQITQILQSDSYNQIHIISHGAPGCLYLGNSELNLRTINKYTPYLQLWFAHHQSHHPPCTLLLYGCNLAEGDRGEKLITKLRELTGAEIAASTNLTGNKHLGGNWDLEATTGEMNVTLAIDKTVLNSYPGVLATFTVTTVVDILPHGT